MTRKLLLGQLIFILLISLCYGQHNATGTNAKHKLTGVKYANYRCGYDSVFSSYFPYDTIVISGSDSAGFILDGILMHQHTTTFIPATVYEKKPDSTILKRITPEPLSIFSMAFSYHSTKQIFKLKRRNYLVYRFQEYN
ncbi:MAG: hypothetical protein JWO06_2295 [Bacteroidota bacterium]|nr:hypothetical protein [Bacteroidota bacterium]